MKSSLSKVKGTVTVLTVPPVKAAVSSVDLICAAVPLTAVPAAQEGRFATVPTVKVMLPWGTPAPGAAVMSMVLVSWAV